jgi:hypothetical protein
MPLHADSCTVQCRRGGAGAPLSERGRQRREHVAQAPRLRPWRHLCCDHHHLERGEIHQESGGRGEGRGGALPADRWWPFPGGLARGTDASGCACNLASRCRASIQSVKAQLSLTRRGLASRMTSLRCRCAGPLLGPACAPAACGRSAVRSCIPQSLLETRPHGVPSERESEHSSPLQSSYA